MEICMTILDSVKRTTPLFALNIIKKLLGELYISLVLAGVLNVTVVPEIVKTVACAYHALPETLPPEQTTDVGLVATSVVNLDELIPLFWVALTAEMEVPEIVKMRICAGALERIAEVALNPATEW